MNHKNLPHSTTQTELKTVLLVDDDANVLRGLKRHLEGDYRVLTAISPAEAYVIVGVENIDLILSDNLMSGVLGTEFLKDISVKHPQIKLLMLSGYMPEIVGRRIMDDHGICQVLTKPCKTTEVAAAIGDALQDSPDELVSKYEPPTGLGQ